MLGRPQQLPGSQAAHTGFITAQMAPPRTPSSLQAITREQRVPTCPPMAIRERPSPPCRFNDITSRNVGGRPPPCQHTGSVGAQKNRRSAFGLLLLPPSRSSQPLTTSARGANSLQQGAFILDCTTPAARLPGPASSHTASTFYGKRRSSMHRQCTPPFPPRHVRCPSLVAAVRSCRNLHHT